MTNTINKKAIGPLNEFDVQNRFLKRLQIASSPCKIYVEIKKIYNSDQKRKSIQLFNKRLLSLFILIYIQKNCSKRHDRKIRIRIFNTSLVE